MENRETENAYFSEDESCYHYCHNNNHSNETYTSSDSSASPGGEDARESKNTCNASFAQQAAEERLVDVAVIGTKRKPCVCLIRTSGSFLKVQKYTRFAYLLAFVVLYRRSYFALRSYRAAVAFHLFVLLLQATALLRSFFLCCYPDTSRTSTGPIPAAFLVASSGRTFQKRYLNR